MNITVGSSNPAKLKAVTEVFPESYVTSKRVQSHVAAQPFSDDETRQGAINRAIACAEGSNNFGIGLEGGVMYIGDQLYLCNWGALVTPEETVYTASGARIILPKELATELTEGKELGYLMDAYANKEDVSKKEGAIGVFTNYLMTRQAMFSHVVTLLRGQWEFHKA
ncbi:MAG: DUF84 family protein [Bacillota bacterium]|uniref:inosine/xanthosine triphosphatase n=1 Tax=Virgibacillus salarius TaxID=447199 RepID=A0A941E2M1_9BACI|nr:MULTISPECIES: DUF84 family protein [Bacillaceae]NAZ10447.1 DUF84 family protein [Agaribacter marinus]MBR7797738.1 DUF84 family protein [Virgibacillus salarius]MCC2250105.1 DUF84 family protein [Virgibacillus sp. AGTR]MDY7046248.1 DUF84 family protein [Virgibacillus sp. M23]QRZ17746.1 DUF84 family protein [Virgibacillus sp. AGTR]